MKALLIVLVALFATTDAYAENVDWSQYLESKSDRPLTKVGSKPETATTTKSSAKASKKKVAKVSKKKARKGKAKRARRR